MHKMKLNIKVFQCVFTVASKKQPEIEGLLFDDRNSLELTKGQADDKKPLTIKQILDDDIKPGNEEYDRLKNLDLRMNVFKFSMNMARDYSHFASPDGTYKNFNRYIASMNVFNVSLLSPLIRLKILRNIIPKYFIQIPEYSSL